MPVIDLKHEIVLLSVSLSVSLVFNAVLYIRIRSQKNVIKNSNVGGTFQNNGSVTYSHNKNELNLNTNPKAKLKKSHSKIRMTDIDQHDGTSLIKDIHLEGKEIIGPATLYIQSAEFTNCTWEDIGFIELPDDQHYVNGAFLLQDSSFKNCRFKNIAIIERHSKMPSVKEEFNK